MIEEYLKAAEDLEQVAALIEVQGMWCKSTWATRTDWVKREEGQVLSSNEIKALGCVEGLMMDVMGLYDHKGVYGELLFTADGGEPDYWVDILRETTAWWFLSTVVGQDAKDLAKGDHIEPSNVITYWNDHVSTTEDDVVVKLHEAAFLAKKAAAETETP